MPEEIVYDSKVNDLAIIGAGPAGLSAAYTAAAEGLSTVVLEEHNTPGSPVHCGECLSKIAEERIGLKIPKEAIAFEAKGIRVIFPNGTSTVLNEPGYCLHKDIFEQYLALRAQGAGAILKTGSRVTAMERKNLVWSINSSSCAIKSRATIDASGFESVSLKLTKSGLSHPKLVNGAQYLMEDVPNDGYIEFFIWPRLAPKGYLWIIPKSNGQANVGLVSEDAPNTHRNLRQFLVQKSIDKNKIIKPFGGVIPCSGPIARTYSDGLLLAGDAAGFTSPMFEGGTQLALKSGELAAETICSLAKQRPSPEQYCAASLKQYEDAWKKEFPPYAKLLQGKKYFYAFNESELNQIASILPPDLTNLTIMDKFAIGVKTLSIAPKLFMKNFAPAMNSFSYSTGQHYGW